MHKVYNGSLRIFHESGASIVEGIDLPMAHMPEDHPSLYLDLLRMTHLFQMNLSPTLTHSDYEFKRNIDLYLASLKNTSVHSVSELVVWNLAHADLAWDTGNHYGNLVSTDTQLTGDDRSRGSGIA